jgi:hypothetical protein
LKLEREIRILVYLSVILGALLLPQTYTLLPQITFSSILIGWIVYLIAAVLVTKEYKHSYTIVFVLAVLTLIVSLPQQEHYVLIAKGEILAALTFILGSAVQVLLIILIPVLVIKRRQIKR